MISLFLLCCAVATTPVLSGSNDAALLTEFEHRQAPVTLSPLRKHAPRLDITRDTDQKPDNAKAPEESSSFGLGGLKVFGVGLSRTGTSSLAFALSQLGLRTIHFDHDLTAYLHRPINRTDLTRWYDDVDAAVDLPSAVYYAELMRAYPDALFISTWREPEAWFRSFSGYLEETSRLFRPAEMPFTITRLHEAVYGSPLPEKDRWIKSYLHHYKLLKDVIPKHKLLHISLEELRQPTGAKRVATRFCKFFGLHPTECPVVEWPHEYSLKSVAKQLHRTKPPTNPLVLPPPHTKRPAFAYVTLLGDQGNAFRQEFVRAAAVWCHSVRLSYPDTPEKASPRFDIVALVRGNLPLLARSTLNRCFDRIVHVHDFATPPPGLADTPYFALVRAKMWVFSLVEYKRVIFMDADQVVVRNIDHYFFRPHYAEGDNSSLSPPLEFYAVASSHAPINSGLFTAEPKLQTSVDMAALYRSGWNNETGWMNYGKFTWAPEPVSVSPQPWPAGAQDVDYPFLPLIPHPPQGRDRWVDASWHFYCSWADQGPLFYYFYLLKKTGGVLEADDADHEVIHYIGVHKPWVDPESYTTQDNADWVSGWTQAAQLWHRLAHSAGLSNSNPLFGGSSVAGAVGAFHKDVNRFKKPGLLANLDPYKSTDARLRYLVLRYCKEEPAFQPSVVSYVCHVPYAVENSTILAVHTYNANAAVTQTTYPLGNLFPLEVGNNPVTVTVRAQAGNIMTYQVILIRHPDNETDMWAEPDPADRLRGVFGAEDPCVQTCLDNWGDACLECSLLDPADQPPCFMEASITLVNCEAACSNSTTIIPHPPAHP